MRCIAVCQDELVIRMLDEVLLPSFDIEFIVESKAVARRLADAGVHVTAADIRRTDTYIRADVSPNTCIIVEDNGRRSLKRILEPIRDAGGTLIYVLGVGVRHDAKREEEVFVPGRSQPIRLDRHDAGLQLLQRARDEAHRFAIGFHRRRRDTRAFESIFDDLEGIGPARRRAILRHFGSADSFLAATQEELEGVPGLPARTARAVYAQLHKAGKG